MISEQWQSIPGYEELYGLSNQGRIKCLTRRDGRWPSNNDRILKHTKTIYGYHQIHLYKNGIRRVFLVHRLVAMLFIDSHIDNCYVHHIDADPANNKVSNLEIVTAGQNNQRIRESGHWRPANTKGERNGRARLSWQQVKEIRQLQGSQSQRQIAKQFGVARTTIQWIHQGKHWKH